jgi:hypothetical protein
VVTSKYSGLNIMSKFGWGNSSIRGLKPVFHFKRTVPKRIKKGFQISKFCECCLVSTSVVRQKVDLRRTFYFDTRIHPEVRGFINLFSICACSPVRFGTIRAKWKTSLRPAHSTEVRGHTAPQSFEFGNCHFKTLLLPPSIGKHECNAWALASPLGTIIHLRLTIM